MDDAFDSPAIRQGTELRVLENFYQFVPLKAEFWADDDCQARKRLQDDELYSKLIAQGGDWWLRVQEWVAKRYDNQAKLEELKPMLDAQKAKIAAIVGYGSISTNVPFGTKS